MRKLPPVPKLLPSRVELPLPKQKELEPGAWGGPDGVRVGGEHIVACLSPGLPPGILDFNNLPSIGYL